MRKNERDNKISETIKDTRITDVAKYLGLNVIRQHNRDLTLCPWHEDRRPSLNLIDNPKQGDRPYYHCFVCGAHGDAIELIKHMRGTTFLESVQLIAEVNGNSLEFLGKSIYDNAAKAKALIGINGLQLALKQYRSRANTTKLEEWATQRGFTKDFLETAGLLWVPARSLVASKHTNWTREELDALLEAGVLRRSYRQGQPVAVESGYLDLGVQLLDFFYEDRVLFPIRNNKGELQGLAGRLVNSDGDRKYIYNLGFLRTKSLYGIDRVWKALKENDKNTKKIPKPFHLFIVEGLMDVLRLEYLGLNAVAVLGSSLSEIKDGQLDLLKKIQIEAARRNKYLICHLFLDQDPAGIDAMLRILPKLIRWSANSEDGIYLDVIEAHEVVQEPRLKDPDDLLHDIAQSNSIVAIERLTNWCVPSLLFMLAHNADTSSQKLSDNWDSLPRLTISEARFQLRKVFAFLVEDKVLLENATSTYLGNIKWPKWLSEIAIELGSKKEKSKEAKLIDDKEAIVIFKKLIRDALGMARSSSAIREFPCDPATWDRLENGLSLFWHMLWERLAKAEPLEPYLPVLLPRPDGGEPRLKTLPCPEDLTLQMYYLLVLLRNVENIPAVMCSRDELSGKLTRFTQGISLPDSVEDIGIGKAVSFAYQINRNSLDSGCGSIFRHYSDCWRDFNTYVLQRVRNCSAQDTAIIVYSARLDIRRYYDAIPQYAVINVLKKSLQDIPISDWWKLLKVEASDDFATTITNRLIKYSFDYPFFGFADGAERNNGSLRGIPQGPDLSAWLGSISLFPVDKIMAQEVHAIIQSFSYTNGITSIIPVATYARYVDDIVLLAPTLSDLNRLRGVLENEIAKLGLELSAKAEPVEPRSAYEFEQWIRHHGGIHPLPSMIGFDGAEVQSMGALKLRAALGGLSRTEALEILHKDHLFFSDPQGVKDNTAGIDTEVMESLRLVANSIEKLRHNDWVKMAEHLWNVISLEGNLDPNKAAMKFFLAWNTLPNSPKLQAKTIHNSEISIAKMGHVVTRAWPVLICLEGLERALIRTKLTHWKGGTDLREHTRLIHQNLIILVSNGLAEIIISNLEDQVNQNIRVILVSRLLSIRQLSGREWNFNYIFHKDVSIVSQLLRRVIGSHVEPNLVKTPLLQSTFPDIVLHGLMVFIERTSKEIENTFPAFWNEWDDTLNRLSHNNEQNDFSLCLALLRSTTHQNEDISVLSRHSSPDKDLCFDILNFLIGRVSTEKQHYFFECHRHIFNGYLPNNAFFLPNPEGVSIPGLLGVSLGENPEGNLLKVYGVIVDESSEVNPLMTDKLSSPFNRHSWSKYEITSNTPKQFSSYESDMQSNPIPMLLTHYVLGKSQTNVITSRDAIKLAVKLYIPLCKALSTDSANQVNASAWNIIIQSENATLSCEVFAWVSEYNDESTQGNGSKTLRAFARILGTGGLKSIPIPGVNAHFWRAGVILADVTGMLWETVEDTHTGLDVPSFGQTDEFLDEVMCKMLIRVLRGSNWWSRPAPNRDEPNKLVTTFPAVIERSLKFAEIFLESQSNADKIMCVFKMQAVHYIMRESKRSSLKSEWQAGRIEHILAQMPVHLFRFDSAMIEALHSLNSEPLRLTPGISYRPVQAWLLIAQVFNYIQRDTKETIAQIIVASCLIRAISLNLRIIATQLLVCSNDAEARLRNLGHDNSEINFALYKELFEDAALTFNNENTDSWASKWQMILDAFTNSTSAKLDNITPIGWLAITVIAADAIQIFESKDSAIFQISLLLKRNTTDLYIVDPLEFVNIVVKLYELDRVVDLITDIEKELKNLLAQKDTLFPLSWPEIKIKEDEHFSLSSRGAKEVGVRAGTMPERLLPVYAVLIENLSNENPQDQEVSSSEKSKHTFVRWYESTCDGELVGVGYLSQGITKLSRIEQAILIEHESSGIIEVSAKKYDKLYSIELPIFSVSDQSQTSIDESQANTGIPDKSQANFQVETRLTKPDNLKNLLSLQDVSWMQRRRRFGRHVRVAFLQIEIEEGYHTPLVEVSRNRHDKHPVIETFGLKESHAEQRRESILNAVLKACEKFQVDALVLPEYTVRPETVIWLFEEMNKIVGYDFSVWAGTYRLTPGWENVTNANLPRNFHKINTPENSALLTLISPICNKNTFYQGEQIDSPDRVGLLQRGKKYPSVATQEFFRPSTEILVPLAKTWRDEFNDHNLPIRAIDFMTELICSEVFVITSPSNIPPATHAYAELLRSFGVGFAGNEDGTQIEEQVRSDMTAISKATGIVHPYRSNSDNEYKRVFVDFPRRTVLLVPACTKRAEDYYLLGKTFHVASGGCLVFCNAVHEKHASGGSCLIGHMSWNNKEYGYEMAGGENNIGGLIDRLSSIEIEMNPSMISPYHGLLPGICLGESHPVAGPLGKNEQALVIVDIDPIHLNEGKPRPQLLPTPQRLIAHLPILEFDMKGSGDWLLIDDKRRNKLTENTEKMFKILEAIEKRLVPTDTVVIEEQGAQSVVPKSTAEGKGIEELYLSLRELADSNIHNSRSWLIRRANQFRLFAQQQPNVWPPPVALDWLLVEHDLSNVPKVYVPPLAPPTNDTE